RPTASRWCHRRAALFGTNGYGRAERDRYRLTAQFLICDAEIYQRAMLPGVAVLEILQTLGAEEHGPLRVLLQLIEPLLRGPFLLEARLRGVDQRLHELAIRDHPLP